MNEKQIYPSGQAGIATTEGGNSSSASQAAGAITEAGKAIAHDVKSVATEVTGQAKQQVASRLEGKKDQVAQGLSSVAAAIRQTGDALRDRDELGVTRYANGIAEQIERLSDYVTSNDVDQLVVEAETFARREPLLFLGGAFALGIVGARFLKASAPAYAGGYALGGNSYDSIRDEPRSDYGRDGGERPSYGDSYGRREAGRSQAAGATGANDDRLRVRGTELGRAVTTGAYGPSVGTGSSPGSKVSAGGYDTGAAGTRPGGDVKTGTTLPGTGKAAPETAGPPVGQGAGSSGKP